MNYRQAMASTLDLLTFLAYAAVLGLCIGALLGGLALVLSAPAHAGEAAASLLLRHAGGEAAAPLVSTDTVLHTDGPIQRVRITQAFRNPLTQRQEGVYVLRLPRDATLERLTVSVRARAGGDDQDEIDQDPPAGPSLAVLSAEDAGVVTRSIAGIEPGELVLIDLEYLQITRYDRGKTGLRLLTRVPLHAARIGRRRRWPSAWRTEPVPLGVESAWVRSAGSSGAPWLWLVPVVLLYVAVAFFS
jgi:hypothetical protein